MKNIIPAGRRALWFVGLATASGFGLAGCDCGCIQEMLGLGCEEETTAVAGEAPMIEQEIAATDEATSGGETSSLLEGLDFELNGDAEFDLASFKTPNAYTSASR